MKTDIATIITCFNRKNKTLACLKNLYKACALYNVNHQTSTIELTVFLTSFISLYNFSDISIQLVESELILQVPVPLIVLFNLCMYV